MATIPVGNFGQAVARSAPIPNAPQGGEVIGRAVDRVGQIAGQVVTNQIDQQRREEASAEADALRERRQQAAEWDRQATEAEHAALRAKTLTTLTGTKDKLADLHDSITNGVLDGSVPKDTAEAQFGTEARKLLEGIGADLPEPNRQIMLAELQSDAGRLGNSVRKAVTQRDRQDVTAGISQTLEFLQRQYKVDPAKATQQMVDTVDGLGPHSTLNPEQLANLKQKWKEDTQYATAFEMVGGARDNRAALAKAAKAIGELPDLDPLKRATLIDRIDMNLSRLDQRDEQARARADREAERRLKLAEAEFNTFQALADKGTQLDPGYIDRVVTATTGTPYQAGVRALAQQAREVGGLAAQPVAVQVATLNAIDAEIAAKGRSPELDRRREQVEKVVRGSQTDAEADALRAGLARGVITDLQPIDFTKGVPGLMAQVQARVPSAQRVSQWTGKPVSPLTDEEAAQVKHQIDALPVRERSGFIAALAQAAGPQQAQGLAMQMAPKDKALSLALAYGSAATTEGRFVSELVLRGAQAKIDGTSTKNEKQPDVKVSQWSANITTQLEGLFPAQTLTDQTREAALLIAHGMAAEGGGRLPEADLERAVRLAIGGTIIERNGSRIPLPAGVDEDMIDKRLRSVTAAELAKQAPDGTVRAGGVAVPLAVFAESLPGQKLMYAGPGRYAVMVGGRAAVNSKGNPIVIGVR